MVLHFNLKHLKLIVIYKKERIITEIRTLPPQFFFRDFAFWMRMEKNESGESFTMSNLAVYTVHLNRVIKSGLR